MDPHETSQEHLDVTPEEGVLARPGERFPKDLGPVITLSAIERYVEMERNRSKRALLWAGAVFAFVALLVLVIFVSIGVFVLRNSRRAVQIVETVQDQTAGYMTEIVDVAERVEQVEDGQKRALETIKEERVQRSRDFEAFKGDLKRFGEWVNEGNNREKRAVAAMEARLQRIEESAESEGADLAELKDQYRKMVSALTPRVEGVPIVQRLVDLPVATVPEGPAAQAGEDRSREEAVAQAAPAQERAVVPAGAAVISVEVPESAAPATGETAVTEAGQDGLGESGGAARQDEIRVVTYPNGDRYEGEFRDGLFHGWGVYYYRNGDVYEGEFRNDMKQGRGTMIYRNADKYIGSFADDMRQGQGRMIFSNGDIYSGDFQNDMMNGKGTMTYVNGNLYTGDFKNGLRHGNGSLRFPNGDLYKGEFFEGSRHGKGTYIFRDGAKYIGEFRNDVRNGQGRYVYAGGEEYVGEFKDGRKDGVGLCIYPDGRRLKGLWKDDRFSQPIDG